MKERPRDFAYDHDLDLDPYERDLSPRPVVTSAFLLGMTLGMIISVPLWIAGIVAFAWLM